MPDYLVLVITLTGEYMAKVIFEITENDALPTDKSGWISVPVTISLGMEGLNDGRSGHSECMALIMK